MHAVWLLLYETVPKDIREAVMVKILYVYVSMRRSQALNNHASTVLNTAQRVERKRDQPGKQPYRRLISGTTSWKWSEGFLSDNQLIPIQVAMVLQIPEVDAHSNIL